MPELIETSPIKFSAEMDDAAIKELRHLQSVFPKEMKRVMAALGWVMRGKMQAAIRGGGPKGHKWADLSRMQRYKRLDMLNRLLPDDRQMYLKGMSKKLYEKQHKTTEFGKAQSYRMAEAMNYWRRPPGGLRPERSMQHLNGAMRYKLSNDGKEVSIGILWPSLAHYFSAVQDGKAVRSDLGGGAVITPKMRRLFWLARIPLSKKRVLDRPKRPLIRPIFDQYKGAIHKFIQLRVQALVVGPYEPRSVTYQKAGFHDFNG